MLSLSWSSGITFIIRYPLIPPPFPPPSLLPSLYMWSSRVCYVCNPVIFWNLYWPLLYEASMHVHRYSQQTRVLRGWMLELSNSLATAKGLYTCTPTGIQAYSISFVFVHTASCVDYPLLPYSGLQWSSLRVSVGSLLLVPEPYHGTAVWAGEVLPGQRVEGTVLANLKCVWWGNISLVHVVSSDLSYLAAHMCVCTCNCISPNLVSVITYC